MITHQSMATIRDDEPSFSETPVWHAQRSCCFFFTRTPLQRFWTVSSTRGPKNLHLLYSYESSQLRDKGLSQCLSQTVVSVSWLTTGFHLPTIWSSSIDTQPFNAHLKHTMDAEGLVMTSLCTVIVLLPSQWMLLNVIELRLWIPCEL